MSDSSTFEGLLETVREAALDLWHKGWAERNAGNISVRLKETQRPVEVPGDGQWVQAGVTVPDLVGEMLLVSATGSYMRQVGRDPREGMGVIEINQTGDAYRKLWGFKSDQNPTSELPSHLLTHAVRKRVSGGADRAMIHTHPTHLVALTMTRDFNTASLTRLLWSMHPECTVVFPEGCGFVPFEVPGGNALAVAGEAALEKHALAVWEYHGVVGIRPDLDAALGLIDTAEKAAAIYTVAASAGGVRRGLSDDQLRAVAESFGLQLDPDLLKG
jgi:rhamnulose-1-phosphate aldolase